MIACSVTIADTVTITGNDGPAAGGICHRKRFDGTSGTLTVIGGSVVTGNTSTSGFQCATVPESGSSTIAAGCVF